jgi:hypothetical protein
MKIENIIDIDDWNIKLPVICQDSKQARAHAPETTPTENFNNDLLFQAIDASKAQALLGMQQATRKMDKTAQLLSQVGIGLHGLDHWHEAHHKQEAAKALSLIFPGIETPPYIKKRSAKIQPPLRKKKALFSILSGIAMGVYRFNREWGINQRLDAIESNHNSTRHTLQDTNQVLQGLDINQDNLQKQILQLDQNQEKFEATVLQWLDNLDARINPILHVQALTLKQ